jgi:hypothetical protein
MTPAGRWWIALLSLTLRLAPQYVTLVLGYLTLHDELTNAVMRIPSTTASTAASATRNQSRGRMLLLATLVVELRQDVLGLEDHTVVVDTRVDCLDLLNHIRHVVGQADEVLGVLVRPDLADDFESAT